MVTADVNRDGKADLIVAQRGSVSGVVLLGRGDGHFTASSSWGVSLGNYSVSTLAVADVNGDGKLDIVTGDDASNVGNGIGGVSVFLGNGTGGFSYSQTYGGLVGTPESIAVSDVNGDGRPDIVVAGYWDGVDVLMNGGNNFPVQSYNGFGLESTGDANLVAAADVNGDTKPDIVVIVGTQANVLLDTGTGTFGAAEPYDLGGAPGSVTLGDVNGDGHVDIVTANVDRTYYGYTGALACCWAMATAPSELLRPTPSGETRTRSRSVTSTTTASSTS
jgi:FG-GAP-like repeat